MNLNQAKQIANKYVELLRPYCERIAIAGSIRREKPEVKDIEIVCIARTTEQLNLLCEMEEVNELEKFLIDYGERNWKWVKSGHRYKQVILPEGIKLDLFIATKENWGVIYAIRTGSSEFSHKVLACGWVKAGYKSIGGVLWKDGKPTYIREEKDLFDLIGLDYIEPRKRGI